MSDKSIEVILNDLTKIVNNKINECDDIYKNELNWLIETINRTKDELLNANDPIGLVCPPSTKKQIKTISKVQQSKKKSMKKKTKNIKKNNFMKKNTRNTRSKRAKYSTSSNESASELENQVPIGDDNQQNSSFMSDESPSSNEQMKKRNRGSTNAENENSPMNRKSFQPMSLIDVDDNMMEEDESTSPVKKRQRSGTITIIDETHKSTEVKTNTSSESPLSPPNHQQQHNSNSNNTNEDDNESQPGAINNSSSGITKFNKEQPQSPFGECRNRMFGDDEDDVDVNQSDFKVLINSSSDNNIRLSLDPQSPFVERTRAVASDESPFEDEEKRILPTQIKYGENTPTNSNIVDHCSFDKPQTRGGARTRGHGIKQIEESEEKLVLTTPDHEVKSPSILSNTDFTLDTTEKESGKKRIRSKRVSSDANVDNSPPNSPSTRSKKRSRGENDTRELKDNIESTEKLAQEDNTVLENYDHIKESSEIVNDQPQQANYDDDSSEIMENYEQKSLNKKDKTKNDNKAENIVENVNESEDIVENVNESEDIVENVDGSEELDKEEEEKTKEEELVEQPTVEEAEESSPQTSWYFEYEPVNSYKRFWKVELVDTNLEISYGKAGNKGRSTTKSYKSVEKALNASEKLKQQKIDKGYIEIDENKSSKYQHRKSQSVSLTKEDNAKLIKKHKRSKTAIDKVMKQSNREMHIDLPSIDESDQDTNVNETTNILENGDIKETPNINNEEEVKESTNESNKKENEEQVNNKDALVNSDDESEDDSEDKSEETNKKSTPVSALSQYLKSNETKEIKLKNESKSSRTKKRGGGKRKLRSRKEKQKVFVDTDNSNDIKEELNQINAPVRRIQPKVNIDKPIVSEKSEIISKLAVTMNEATNNVHNKNQLNIPEQNENAHSTDDEELAQRVFEMNTSDDNLSSSSNQGVRFSNLSNYEKAILAESPVLSSRLDDKSESVESRNEKQSSKNVENIESSMNNEKNNLSNNNTVEENNNNESDVIVSDTNNENNENDENSENDENDDNDYDINASLNISFEKYPSENEPFVKNNGKQASTTIATNNDSKDDDKEDNDDDDADYDSDSYSSPGNSPPPKKLTDLGMFTPIAKPKNPISLSGVLSRIASATTTVAKNLTPNKVNLSSILSKFSSNNNNNNNNVNKNNNSNEVATASQKLSPRLVESDDSFSSDAASRSELLRQRYLESREAQKRKLEMIKKMQGRKQTKEANKKVDTNDNNKDTESSVDSKNTVSNSKEDLNDLSVNQKMESKSIHVKENTQSDEVKENNNNFKEVNKSDMLIKPAEKSPKTNENNKLEEVKENDNTLKQFAETKLNSNISTSNQITLNDNKAFISKTDEIIMNKEDNNKLKQKNSADNESLTAKIYKTFNTVDINNDSINDNENTNNVFNMSNNSNNELEHEVKLTPITSKHTPIMGLTVLSPEQRKRRDDFVRSMMRNELAQMKNTQMSPVAKAQVDFDRRAAVDEALLEAEHPSSKSKTTIKKPKSHDNLTKSTVSNVQLNKGGSHSNESTPSSSFASKAPPVTGINKLHKAARRVLTESSSKTTKLNKINKTTKLNDYNSKKTNRKQKLNTVKKAKIDGNSFLEEQKRKREKAELRRKKAEELERKRVKKLEEDRLNREAQAKQRREEEEKAQRLKLMENEKKRKEVVKRGKVAKTRNDKASNLLAAAKNAVERETKANPPRTLPSSNKQYLEAPSTPKTSTKLAIKLVEQSTPVQYEMSPVPENFDDSSEEEDPETVKGKKLPRWVRKRALNEVLERQANIDPDLIFPPTSFDTTCNIEEVFSNFEPTRQARRHRKRSDSGDWSHAKSVLQKEHIEYKKKMGYLK